MLTHRLATEADLPALTALMALAIDGLQHGFLSPAEIIASRSVMGLDTQLIADRTYFLVEDAGRLAGCGGWSRRATLYGGDHSTSLRDPALLDPARDAARVRAMYTHPDFARRGVARRVLNLCEEAAREAGFRHVELMATLAGEPLYRSCGYLEIERVRAPAVDGVTVPLIHMGKCLADDPMRQTLNLRSHSPCAAAIAVEAAAARPHRDVLTLNYGVTGAIGALYLPPAEHLARADVLWRRTCFEAFVRPALSDAYFEFNFAPSRQWAAYRFDGYRSGMRPADDIAPADIETRTTDWRFELRVSLALPNWLDGRAWRVGLSAVIEEVNGEKSYWALAHPPGKPDFHHPDSFALDLSSAESA